MRVLALIDRRSRIALGSVTWPLAVTVEIVMQLRMEMEVYQNRRVRNRFSQYTPVANASHAFLHHPKPGGLNAIQIVQGCSLRAAW